MATVRLTPHLHRFFPQLAAEGLELPAATVAELVAGLEALAPGVAFYLCDERGRLRPHVNVFIGNDLIRDRARLSDALAADDHVSILQALSGG